MPAKINAAPSLFEYFQDFGTLKNGQPRKKRYFTRNRTQWSDEVKEKISKSMTGKTKTEEHKKRIGQSVSQKAQKRSKTYKKEIDKKRNLTRRGLPLVDENGKPFKKWNRHEANAFTFKVPSKPPLVETPLHENKLPYLQKPVKEETEFRSLDEIIVKPKKK